MDINGNIYFVGAVIGNEDYTENFIDEGKWELGWYGSEENIQYQNMLSIYKQIKIGDTLVIKSSYTKKNNLPFPNPTNSKISVMKLKAIGKVTKNVGDGHTIIVDWNKEYQPKEWYFFTNRQTIWSLSSSNSESAQKLIEFVKEDKPQDYEWFLSQQKSRNYNDNIDRDNQEIYIMKDVLTSILEFFVRVGQEKILTKANHETTTVNNKYYRDNRVNTSNNTLSLHTNAWKVNIDLYQDKGVQEEWFSNGLECMHFANGNTQNKNYAWRNASIHFSLDHKHSIEFMFDMKKANTDNLIYGLNAKIYKVYDDDGNHTNNQNSYTSKKGDAVIFKIPVEIIQSNDGKIDQVNIKLDDELFLKFNNIISSLPTYFDTDIIEDDSIEEERIFKGYLNSYSDDVIESKNVIFRGAPGTGKSFLAKEIAADIVSNGYVKNYLSLSLEEKNQIEFVQFHPSYDYSDFVEGLRPKVNDDGTMGFKLQDGVFTKFVARAQKNYDDSKKTQEKEKKFVFIIDEINRGEISKIFGELFFAIDPGCRGTIGEVSTQYINLHENPNEKFSIPENVYIIGTMNDIDRSVDSFDFAMRRRFRFIEIKADEQLEMLESLGDDLEAEAIKRMSALNDEISKVEELNENYHIGASYFLKLKTLSFDKLWTDYLQPLLQDYIRGMYDEEAIMKKFKKAYSDSSTKLGDNNENIDNQ